MKNASLEVARIAEVVARVTAAVAEAKTSDEARMALSRVANAGIRLGYAAYLMAGDAPDVETARRIIDIVAADHGANGHVIGGKP